jgi:hypothetical protein
VSSFVGRCAQHAFSVDAADTTSTSVPVRAKRKASALQTVLTEPNLCNAIADYLDRSVLGK